MQKQYMYFHLHTMTDTQELILLAVQLLNFTVFSTTEWPFLGPRICPAALTTIQFYTWHESHLCNSIYQQNQHQRDLYGSLLLREKGKRELQPEDK